jgi:hypothetical protein
MSGAIESVARLVAAMLATSPFLSFAARAETVTGVGVSGSTEYSANPFLLNAKDTAAVKGQLTVSPFIEARSARSTLRVASSASASVYSRRYRETLDLSTQVDYRNAVSRNLSVRAGVAANSTVFGSYNLANIFAPVVNPGVAPQIIDITLVGSIERTVQASGSMGASYNIDDKNLLTLDYSGSVVRYPKSIGRPESATIGQTVGYSRTLSARASVGASIAVSKVNYFQRSFGDSTIISPSLNGSVRLSAQWTLAAGIGLSFTRINLGGPRLAGQNLSGNLNLCRADSRSNFCVTGSRATSASAFDSLRITTSAGANFSYKLSARDSLSASGGYSRSTAPSQLRGLPIDYLTGTTSLSRRFSDRLSGNVTAGFARSTFGGTRSSAYGLIGINFSFGKQ